MERRESREGRERAVALTVFVFGLHVLHGASGR
jgi:hypothetical protein